MNSIFSDFIIHAIKTGMLVNEAYMELVADKLENYPEIKLVITGVATTSFFELAQNPIFKMDRSNWVLLNRDPDLNNLYKSQFLSNLAKHLSTNASFK